MFKSMIKLLSRPPAIGSGCVDDRAALAFIEQEYHRARRELRLARRELGAALAAERTESHRLRNLQARMATLEGRAIAAVRAGFGGVAEDVASDIATLGTDCLVGHQCLAVLRGEIERHTHLAQSAERRMARCERGRRVIEAEQAVRALRDRATGHAEDQRSALSDAEATLVALRRSHLQSLTSPRPEMPARTGFPPLRQTGAALPPPTAAEVLIAIRNRAVMASRSA
jgi:phage shock protein A